jgi:hypothetical protein
MRETGSPLPLRDLFGAVENDFRLDVEDADEARSAFGVEVRGFSMSEEKSRRPRDGGRRYQNNPRPNLARSALQNTPHPFAL